MRRNSFRSKVRHKFYSSFQRRRRSVELTASRRKAAVNCENDEMIGNKGNYMQFDSSSCLNEQRRSPVLRRQSTAEELYERRRQQNSKNRQLKAASLMTSIEGIEDYLLDKQRQIQRTVNEKRSSYHQSEHRNTGSRLQLCSSFDADANAHRSKSLTQIDCMESQQKTESRDLSNQASSSDTPIDCVGYEATATIAPNRRSSHLIHSSLNSSDHQHQQQQQQHEHFNSNHNSQRSRRGALMVSEEDGVDDSSLCSQDNVIRTLKFRSTHSRKSGSIFSNPFKTDREKMDKLTELLNYYSANGIPDVSGAHTSKRSRTLDDVYDLEDHWQCLVDNSEELPKRLQNQQDAIWELLQTEVSYVKMLNVISELFHSCLCALQSESLLSDVDNEKMFSNISEVYTANHQLWIDYLLPMLNESRNTHQPLNPLLMTDAFLNFEQIFQPYIKYCLEHSSCLHFVKKKHKESELFKAYVVWCETRKDCDRLRLMDILVKPMQRLTKYSLLLKAILKKTDDEQQKEALKQMNHSVEKFVYKVDATLRRRNDVEKLASVANRIESYDVFDTSNDEVEKVLREYSNFDLNCPMLGCQSRQIRQLLLEGSGLKLRDSNTSGKLDVHCFLFTDILLVCKSVGKKSGDKVRVIRQPYLIDRLVIHELKDNTGFIVIYLNEFNVATAVFTLHSADSKTWVDFIRKAQKKYKESKQSALLSAQSSYRTFEEDEEYEFPSTTLLHATHSSLRSSRSSLVQSHSGSVEMSEPSVQGSMIVAPLPTPSFLSQMDVNEHNPSRAVSFELGELRNPSMTVDDLDAFGRSKSMETRTPVSVTVTSPRPERRAFLLRGAGAAVSVGSTNTNTLSVNVPFHVSKPSQAPSEPPSIQVPVFQSPGRLLQRSVQTMSKPPLVKTKNVPAPSLTVHSAPSSTGVSPVYSLESEAGSESGGSDEQESLKSRLNQKRNNRGERRYHTADSIDNIKKDKDSSIHKRLSWNLGANQANNRLLCNKHLIKCLSSDSVYTSSGFSSTESVTLSVGSDQCATDTLSHIEEIDRIPDEQHKEQSTIKIDVSEVKDGISSVQITVNGKCAGKPSKTDLKKMKELLLTSLDASEV